MNEFEQLWAGWRSEYVTDPRERKRQGCVFCQILSSDLAEDQTYIVHRDDKTAVLLNAFPYGTGHVLVMPVQHVGELEELSDEQKSALWGTVQTAAATIKHAYAPDGMNIGLNLGEAAGAGIPAHLHVHVLPRWNADTNFMASIANTKVLPEALNETWAKLRKSWPGT